MVRDEGPNLPAVHPQRAMGLLLASDLWELLRAIRDLSWGPHAFHGVWGASAPVHPNPCRPKTMAKVAIVCASSWCLSTLHRPRLLDCQPLVALGDWMLLQPGILGRDRI